MESKAAAKARLQAEGRWKPALKYRESMKAEGKTPDEAHALMVAAFPPLKDGPRPAAAPAIAPAQESGGPEQASGFLGLTPAPEAPPAKKRRRRRRPGARIDWRRDAEWVYENMAEDQHDGRPPSNGALALLAYAKLNPSEFFRSFAARLLPLRAAANTGKDDEAEGKQDVAMAELVSFMKSHGHERGQQTGGTPTEPTPLPVLPLPVYPRLAPAPQPAPAAGSATAAPEPARQLVCHSCTKFGHTPGCAECWWLRHTFGEEMMAVSRAR
jgi:hypothetical protein